MPKFCGIIPPMVTPLKAFDQLDLEAVSRVANHLITGGVNGLFVLGTTGEGPSLNYQIRYELVERTCEIAAQRIPVLVGVTDSSIVESIELTRHAATCGASAVVAAAPFYFACDQSALVDWFRQLADAAPLPLVLYNMPSCVNVTLELPTVMALAEHENIVGIKDSSGDLTYFSELCRQVQTDEFAVIMGPEELIPEAVAAGADGGVTGGGNLLPAVYVRMFRAAKAGDLEETERLQAIVSAVFDGIYRDPRGVMNLIPALKLAMSRTGLCRSIVAPPLKAPCDAHVSQIDDCLQELLQLTESPLTVPA